MAGAVWWLMLLLGTSGAAERSIFSEKENEWRGARLFDKGPLRQNLSTLAAHMRVDQLSRALRSLANDEIGVTRMQAILDGLPFYHVPLNYSAVLEKVWQSVDETVSSFERVLERSRRTVQAYHDTNPLDMHVFRPFKECCRLGACDLAFDAQFGCNVNRSFSCDIVSPTELTFIFYPGKNLTAVYRQNGEQLVGMRWQYFISAKGSHMEYPAHAFAAAASNYSRCMRLEKLRHRAEFVAAALPYPKRAVLLIECGHSLSDAQLDRSKAVVRLLLDSFSERDLVTVVAVADGLRTPCDGHLLPANWETKALLKRFVDGVRREPELANHSIGFARAYQLLSAQWDEEDGAASGARSFIFYVSRGLLSSLAEAGQVMQAIARQHFRSRVLVQINTIPVIDRGKTPLWETQFLRDVAEQNFRKYAQQFPKELQDKVNAKSSKAPLGKMVVVNASETDILTLPRVFELLRAADSALEPDFRQAVVWSGAARDPLSGAGALTLSAPVWSRDGPAAFVGVVGQQLSLGALAAALDERAFDSGVAHALLLGVDGAVLVHPLLSVDSPYPTLLADIDGWRNRWSAANVVRRMTSSPTGEAFVLVSRHNQTRRAAYYWKRLSNSPFTVVLCAVTSTLYDTPHFHKIPSSHLRGLTYHRLDLQLSEEVGHHCLNLRQLSTTDRGGVYLSPNCFLFAHRRRSNSDESRLLAASYWAYLGDTIGLIQNPGLRADVKGDVAVLSAIVSYWRQRFANSAFRYGVLRRFIATTRGVLVTYPATLLNADYDPTTRDWFRRALQSPGEIVITGPYLDPSGAGYVVTLSHTVFEGKSAMHQPTDRVFAVMAVDLPVSVLYKQLVDAVHVCRKPSVSCLILTERGYLAARADPLLNGTSAAPSSGSVVVDREPIEGRHVTHVESQLAMALLQRPDAMRKHLCLSHATRTVQREYRLNTSLADALQVRGREPAGCVRYQLTHVPRTNALLAVVNGDCAQQYALRSAFCPCSLSDRRCLLCTRTDARECECPCECAVAEPPWLRDRCPSDAPSSSSLPSCDLPQSHFSLPLVHPSLLAQIAVAEKAAADSASTDDVDFALSSLPQCIRVKCSAITSIEICLGVVGCQWCFREESGQRRLAQPFCSPISYCFGGVRGKTLDGQAGLNEASMSISTPVGPVAGAIMVVFVAMVVGVYCYRHHMTRFLANRAGSGARLHMAVCDDDDDDDVDKEFHFDHDGSAASDQEASAGAIDKPAVGNLLLASFERDNGTPRANWRPGPRTETSDHGYSTMTDRNCDDSERGTTVEPLLIAPNTRLPRSPRADADDAPPAGMTSLDCTATSSLLGEPTVVTTTALVHAVDALA